MHNASTYLSMLYIFKQCTYSNMLPLGSLGCSWDPWLPLVAKQAKQASKHKNTSKHNREVVFLRKQKTRQGNTHPDGLLDKRSFFGRKQKTPLRGAAVHPTACFYQVLIDIWSIVPFARLFMDIF